MWYLLATRTLGLAIKKQVPVWQSCPSSSSFWGPFLPLQEMQNLRLQINLGLGEQYCHTTGSASRRLLNSTARLPKSSEAWHTRKGSPWGPLAVPVSYRSEFPAPLLFSFPHPPAKKVHGGIKTKSRSQEAHVQPRLCLYWCARGQPASPPQIPYLKSALVRPHLESLSVLTSDSRSIPRALVLCA